MKIKNGSFKYNNKHVFEEVNLTIDAGEIVAIIGSNGSGKTTLLKCIADIMPLSSGEILNRKGNLISFVPDVPMAYEYLTGYEYLQFVESIGENHQIDRVKNILKLYTLYEQRDVLIKYYSYGMRQKLSLCAALIDENVDYILLDEPLTGVDKKSQDIIIQNLKALSQEGVTVVFSTHQIDTLQKMCNKIYCMDENKVIHLDDSQHII